MKKYAVLIALALSAALLHGCAGALLVTAGGAGAMAAKDQRTVGTMIDDQAIELRAAMAVNRDPELSAQSHVNFTSFNGIVLITGEAPTEALKMRIQRIVEALPKMRRFHNLVEIAAPSSLLARANDATLTGRVKTAMLTNAQLADAAWIKVVTESGVVHLMAVTTQAQGKLAVETARQVGGVRKIVTLFEYTD